MSEPGSKVHGGQRADTTILHSLTLLHFHALEAREGRKPTPAAFCPNPSCGAWWAAVMEIHRVHHEFGLSVQQSLLALDWKRIYFITQVVFGVFLPGHLPLSPWQNWPSCRKMQLKLACLIWVFIELKKKKKTSKIWQVQSYMRFCLRHCVFQTWFCLHLLFLFPLCSDSFSNTFRSLVDMSFYFCVQVQLEKTTHTPLGFLSKFYHYFLRLGRATSKLSLLARFCLIRSEPWATPKELG